MAISTLSDTILGYSLLLSSERNQVIWQGNGNATVV
jgi:hypothetical protein